SGEEFRLDERCTSKRSCERERQEERVIHRSVPARSLAHLQETREAPRFPGHSSQPRGDTSTTNALAEGPISARFGWNGGITPGESASAQGRSESVPSALSFFL